MIKWVLVPLVAFLFSFHALAKSPKEAPYNPTSFFITHDQFMSLTNAEQKTYVKKVKELVLEMSTTFPLLAAEMSARSNLYRQLWNLSMPVAYSEEKVEDEIPFVILYSLKQAGEYTKDIENTKTKNMSEENRQYTVKNYRQALYWTSVAAAHAYHIKDEKLRKRTLKNYVVPASKKVSANERKIKTIAKESEYLEARDQYFKKSLNGGLSLTAPFPSDEDYVAYEDRIRPTSTNGKSNAPTSEVPLPAVPAPKKPGTPAPSQPITADNGLYRCMYAGFVIKKDPCMAPQELPWALKGLDSNTFVCEDDTIMCNPFIFGFNTQCDWSTALEKGRTDSCWATAKPHCVKAGRTATKSCTNASNKDSSLQAAVELIKENPAAFNQFGVSFADLCYNGMIDFNSYPRRRTPENTQRTKDDIKKTCAVAKLRMEEIEKRYSLTRYPMESAPKAAPKPAGPPTGRDLLMVKPNKGKK